MAHETHSTRIIVSNPSNTDKQIKLLNAKDLFEPHKWKESGKYSFDDIEIYTDDEQISYKDILINCLSNSYAIAGIILEILISTSKEKRLLQLEETNWRMQKINAMDRTIKTVPFFVQKLVVDDRAKQMNVDVEYLYPNYYKSRFIKCGYFWNFFNSETFIEGTINANTEIAIQLQFAPVVDVSTALIQKP